MVLNFILFIFYLVLFSWLLTKSAFIKQTGWGVKLIVGLFCVKVAMGVLNGWIYNQLFDSDSWSFHRAGLREYFLLFKDPKEYFSKLFYSADQYGYSGFFKSADSFWNDMKTDLMIKIDSVLDIVSFGNYYINVILYNFLTFFGIVALYKVFAEIYCKRKMLVLVSVILLPSFLFFGSSYHKDGIVAASIGILVYTVFRLIHGDGLSVRRMAVSVFAFLLLLFFRNYVLILLLPAFTGWYLSVKMKRHPLLIYLVIYTLGVFIFFNLHLVLPSTDLPGIIVEKQKAFLMMEPSRSYVEINPLTSTCISFISAAPKAIMNAMLRPFLWDGGVHFFLFPLSVEIIIYELLFFLFFIFPEKSIEITNRPFIYFGLFFGISILLITGYIVPVLGAIVRYRSIYFPFIITPVICGINWSRIKSKLQFKK